MIIHLFLSLINMLFYILDMLENIMVNIFLNMVFLVICFVEIIKSIEHLLLFLK